jgi:hypothetical protein
LLGGFFLIWLLLLLAAIPVFVAGAIAHATAFVLEDLGIISNNQMPYCVILISIAEILSALGVVCVWRCTRNRPLTLVVASPFLLVGILLLFWIATIAVDVFWGATIAAGVMRIGDWGNPANRLRLSLFITALCCITLGACITMVWRRNLRLRLRSDESPDVHPAAASSNAANGVSDYEDFVPLPRISKVVALSQDGKGGRGTVAVNASAAVDKSGNDKYWLRRGNVTKGPVTKTQVHELLKTGKILESDMASSSPDGPWKRIGSLAK